MVLYVLTQDMLFWEFTYSPSPNRVVYVLWVLFVYPCLIQPMKVAVHKIPSCVTICVTVCTHQSYIDAVHTSLLRILVLEWNVLPDTSHIFCNLSQFVAAIVWGCVSCEVCIATIMWLSRAKRSIEVSRCVCACAHVTELAGSDFMVFILFFLIFVFCPIIIVIICEIIMHLLVLVQNKICTVHVL